MNRYGFILDPDETITRVVHRSFVDLLPPIVMAFFLLAAALGLAYLDGRSPSFVPFPQILVLTLVLLLAVIGALILLIGIYTYKRNVLVFTNKHLVEVYQPTLFSRQVSQLTYNHVQDVTGHRSGFWATILDFGDVQIQSAAEQEKFIFHRAPHPQVLADEALQIRDHCLAAMAADGGAAVQPVDD